MIVAASVGPEGKPVSLLHGRRRSRGEAQVAQALLLPDLEVACAHLELRNVYPAQPEWLALQMNNRFACPY